MLASEMGSKPYLILEIDAHTADAGVQTRLEAFLDIVRNYRPAQSGRRRAVHPGRLVRRSGRPIERRAGGAHRPAGANSISPTFRSTTRRPWRWRSRWLGLHAGATLPPGPQPARPRPAVHLGPRVPAAADLHRPAARDPRAARARRDRRFLHAARRRALRHRLPTWATRAVHRRAAPGGSVPASPPPTRTTARLRQMTLAKHTPRGAAGGRHPGRDRAGASRSSAPAAAWSTLEEVAALSACGASLGTSSTPRCPASSSGWRRCRAPAIRGPARGSW